MRGVLSLALGAMLVAAQAGADRVIEGKHLPLVVPAGSPIRLAEIADEISYARFEGAFVLTGVYHISYSPAKSGDGGYTGAYFEPDKKLVARLPYWQPYKQHASQITFDNPDDFVKAVGTKNAKPHTRWTSSGRTAIKVTGYKTGVECDWPWFTVHFVSIERTPVLLADAKDDDIGC